MLKPEIETALNAQINQEQAAAREYLAMHAYFTGQNLKGFAAFMRRQCEEEREHAMKFYDYVFDRGGMVKLQSLPQPADAYASPLAAFQAAYQYEQKNTASIHALYKLATDHQDYATQTHLHWFIEEQVEEEAWCEEAIALLETVGNDPSALFMLDHRYGQTPTE